MKTKIIQSSELGNDWRPSTHFAEGEIICGAKNIDGDACTLLPEPHRLHACWKGLARGVRVWDQRDVAVITGAPS